jgi:hypothetical protein
VLGGIAEQDMKIFLTDEAGRVSVHDLMTNPPVTNPPVTNPPVTDPSAINPPATNPKSLGKGIIKK